MTRRGPVLVLVGRRRILPLRVVVAASLPARLRGWIGRVPATGDGALWLVGVRAVHTFGVRGPIDVVFVGAEGHVLRVRPRVEPRRVLVGPWGTRDTLELPPGDAARLGVGLGERLRLVAALEHP